MEKSGDKKSMITLHIYDWKDGYNHGDTAQSFLMMFTGKKKEISEKEKLDAELAKEKKQRELLVELYKTCLKDDEKFHFFYEPDIIIRLSSALVIEKVKELLSSKGIKFTTYDYPTPFSERLVVGSDKNIYCYGEEKGGIVMKNFDLFITIFHAHSTAALSMSDSEHFEYMERVIHTMFNPRAYSRLEEGEHLAKLAIYKAGYAGVMDVLQSK